MFCNNCGTKLNDGDMFCHACGASMKHVQMNNAQQNKPPVTTQDQQPKIEQNNTQPQNSQSDWLQTMNMQANTVQPQTQQPNMQKLQTEQQPQNTHANWQQPQNIQPNWQQQQNPPYQPEAYNTNTVNAVEMQPKKKSKAPLIIIIVLLALLAIGAALYFFVLKDMDIFGSGSILPGIVVNEPEDTVAKFEKAMNEGDVDALMECLYFDDSTDLDYIRQNLERGFNMLDSNGVNYNLKINVQSVEYNDDKTECDITMEMLTTTSGALYGDDMSDSDVITVRMVKEGNEWLFTGTEIFG